MPGRSNALFERLECVGEHRLWEFTGGFSPSGKPEFTAGTINAETLMRFKRNQSPAVIVLDFDPDRADEALDWRKAYCVLARVTVACDVLVAAGEWVTGAVGAGDVRQEERQSTGVASTWRLACVRDSQIANRE